MPLLTWHMLYDCMDSQTEMTTKQYKVVQKHLLKGKPETKYSHPAQKPIVHHNLCEGRVQLSLKL